MRTFALSKRWFLPVTLSLVCGVGASAKESATQEGNSNPPMPKLLRMSNLRQSSVALCLMPRVNLSPERQCGRKSLPRQLQQPISTVYSLFRPRVAKA